jgi:serine protease AprX
VHSAPIESSARGALICPICGRSIAPEIRSLVVNIEAPVVRRLQKANPGWKAETGACPECIGQAVEAARVGRSHTSLHEELLVPYPIYSREEAHLIPTPLRVGANPAFTGQGVTLAFLDSGFYPHPDLIRPENRILCYVDATGKEPVEKAMMNKPDRASWHGLMTSCVAAGSGYKSGHSFRGIANRSDLVLVKTGSASSPGISEADIQRALAWVIANRERFNIRIVNISLGGDFPTHGKLSELDEMVEKAVAAGLVVITAAGNSAGAALVPPATAPSAITVGGLDDANSYNRKLWRMYHSSYGFGALHRPKPDLIAPATWLPAPMLPRTQIHNQGILLWQIDRLLERLHTLLEQARAQQLFDASDLRAQLKNEQRHIRLRMIKQKYVHSHYQHVDGTSMAAPVVSSIAAQVLEANPELTPTQVKLILTGTASRLEDIALERQGAGLVNAALAVAAAQRTSTNAWRSLPFSPNVRLDGVRFYYLDPGGKYSRASVIGSFNGWDPRAHPMQRSPEGLWHLSVPPLPPGSYRYKFLLDTAWVNDPENTNRLEDGQGGFDSMLATG